MPEPVEPTTLTTEPVIVPEPLTPLQLAHNEVLAKRKLDKLRIEQLEAKVAEAESANRELTINGPVRAMMASLSIAPESLQSELLKAYKIELQDTKLTLLTLDGKPTGIPFEREPLMKMLLATTDEAQRKLFGATLIVSRASGGDAVRKSSGSKNESAPKHQFGLR